MDEELPPYDFINFQKLTYFSNKIKAKEQWKRIHQSCLKIFESKLDF